MTEHNTQNSDRATCHMFGFPNSKKTPNFKFRRTFLKSVIFQVRFENQPEIISNKVLIDELLGDRFSASKKIVTGGLKLEVSDGHSVPKIQTQPTELSGFEYYTSDSKRSLNIAINAITFTVDGQSYENFEIEFQNYSEILHKLSKKFEIQKFNRIAIRKVNLFEAEPDSGQADIEIFPFLFNKNVSSSVLNFPNNGNIKSYKHELIFQNGSSQLNLRFGIIPESLRSEPILCALDIDLFQKETTGLEELNNKMSTINDEVFNIFMYMVNSDIVTLLQQETI